MVVAFAVPWYESVRMHGLYLGTAIVVLLIVVLGLLFAATGRRLGCPPVVRERFLEVAPTPAYEQVLARLQAEGARIDFREPAIRVVAFEGKEGHSYRRIPKEIEVRFIESPPGTRIVVTVRYLAAVLVDSGESGYARGLADRILGEPADQSGGRYGWPLPLYLSLSGNAVAAGALVATRLLWPDSFIPLAPEIEGACLSAVILSLMAVWQGYRSGDLLGGRRIALVSLTLSLLELGYFLGRYLLYLS